MSWDTSLNTGIDIIDFQHMELVENAESFAQACENNVACDYINKTLNFLEEYVIEHFLTEEKLQQSCNYPGYLDHKISHDYFIQDFTELKDKIDEQGESITIIRELNEFLISWVINHISNEDIVFAKYYKAFRPDLDIAGI